MEPNEALRRVPIVDLVAIGENDSDPEVEALLPIAFEEFWRSERTRVGRALALTLGDSQLATEAVDEAMARAFQRWPQVCRLESPSGWVYRVGLNWSHSVLRRTFRRPPSWMLTGDTDADDRYEPAIDAALAALPVPQRSVVVCRLLLGLSEAQTADAFRIRPGTVKSRLSRAVNDLSVSLSHLDPNLEPKEAAQ